MSEISAKVIRATRNPEVASSVITTVQVTAPRFLLAEVNTHGLLAKSAASSRAIPVKKRIEMVRDHGFIPKAFGKNKKGMQADSVLGNDDATKALRCWKGAMEAAVFGAEGLLFHDVHKQHANRILEPFAYYSGILTATEWDNFFELRLHPDAQPEFQELARQIKKALDESDPVTSEYHHPYVTDEEFNRDGGASLQDWNNVSAARCARISYTMFDGRPTTMAEDLELCAKLISGGHMSPFDHVAISDVIIKPKGQASAWYNQGAQTTKHWAAPRFHGRFWGWVPMRYFVESSLNKKTRRDSFEGFNE